MGNVRNKAQLIQLLSNCTSESNVRLIGEANCTFGHEEADVNTISYALLMIKEHGKKYVQIVSDDTNVFVLLLFFYWKLRLSARISMKKFTGSIIDINATALKLGDKCFQLLPLHAATGCDSVSYAFGKGKAAAVKLLLKSDDLGLNILGETTTPGPDIVQIGSKLFAELHVYGARAARAPTTINKLCYKLFSKSQHVPNIRSLPPTDESLDLHLKRAHLQAMIWKAGPPDINICDFGWEMVDNVPSPIRGNGIVGQRN